MQVNVSSASSYYPAPYLRVSQQLAPARWASSSWSSDQLRLSAVSVPQPLSTQWTPAMKIALMASPVAAGVGIGLLARSGSAVGGLVGGAIGAAVSVVGLWWFMTIGNPFDRNPSPDLPPPPKPGA